MSSKPALNVEFRFVEMGAVAPPVLPPNELWLDVGNRLGGRVLDHHSGDTDAGSASELILESYEQHIVAPLKGRDSLTIVLHATPDLDAIFASWLAIRVLRDGNLESSAPAIGMLVRDVTANDQGMMHAHSPSDWWPLIFREELNLSRNAGDDNERVRAGLTFLDAAMGWLERGTAPSGLAALLTSARCRQVIARAHRDYVEDLRRGLTFQVRLPVAKHRRRQVDEDGPAIAGAPDEKETRWALTDALFLDTPCSALFKEMARLDSDHSPLGQGFGLLIVSRPSDEEIPGLTLRRHIISTDPVTGLQLTGLGRRLEELEQRKEDELAAPLRPGRDRIDWGTGRHGYNVMAPWYDGRGHEYTILDAPSCTVAGRHLGGSVLSSQEVLDAVWDYGNPARFVEVHEAQVTLYVPVKSRPGRSGNTAVAERLDALSMAQFAPCLREVFSSTVTGEGISAFGLPVTPESNALPPEALESQCLWRFPEGSQLWVGTYNLASNTPRLEGLCGEVSALVTSRLTEWLATIGLERTEERTWHLVHARVARTNFPLAERSLSSLQVQTALAMGQPLSPRFQSLPPLAAGLTTHASDDGQTVFCSHKQGSVAISCHQEPLDTLRGFQRPSLMRVLVALAVGQNGALARLANSFSEHRAAAKRSKAADLIVSDRARLFNYEQTLNFCFVTDDEFGQNAYEATAEALGIREQLADTRDTITAFSAEVTESRSRFYQGLATAFSVLFAPLALTMGFFSGAHMRLDYPNGYHTLLPRHLEPAGWLQFGAVLVSIVALSASIFAILRWLHSRESILGKGADPDFEKD